MSIRLLGSLLLALAAGTAAAAAPPCGGFLEPERHALPANPDVMAVADFNVDGLPDAAVASNTSMSVFLGQPGAELAPAIPGALPFRLTFLVAGHFDDDGKPDLFGADGSALFWLAGNGDGTFQPPVFVNNLNSLESLTAADVDGDGNLDVVAIVSSESPILVFLGHGDGTMDPPIATPLPNSALNSISLGDLNGDGHLDAAVAGYFGDTLVWLRGLGDGAFGTPSVLGTDAARWSVRIADFDGDGKLDVAAAGDAVVEVFPGGGNGTFASPIPSFEGRFPGRLLPADLDSDGILDLVVPQYDFNTGIPGAVRILIGRGDASFETAQAYVQGPSPGDTVVADFDGDGHPDIALTKFDLKELWRLAGRGDGSFGGVPDALPGAPSLLLASGDFDQDGRADLASTGFDPFPALGDRLTVATSELDGAFQATAVIYTAGNFADMVTGDFHGEGHLDLAMIGGAFPNSSLVTLEGHGDGTFGPDFGLGIEGLPQSPVYALALGQFDTGAPLDLALTTWAEDNRSGAVTILLGNGDATFTLGPSTPLPDPPAALAAADFDADGDLDLAVATLAPGSLFVLSSAGDGTFSVSPPYALGDRPTSVVAADIDGDGNVDILVTDETTSTLAIFSGHGDGIFDPPSFVATGVPGLSAAAADFNGDGHIDVLTSGGFDGKVSLLLGYGDGSFLSPATFVASAHPGQVVVGDFDGDGVLDGAVGDTSGYSGGVGILSSVGIHVRSVSAIVGQTATLQATDTLGATSFQWRKDGVPLSDGGPISGATTTILTIDPVAFTDAGSYDVVMTTELCGTVTSHAATLSVEFADVPSSSPFHEDIIEVATAGIAAGCGGGDYCPASPVRRDQVAVFLLKSEHGAAYAPPACSGIFADVPCPGPFTDWVEQLATEGVTGGCGGGNFCPDDSVTRAQMSIFLLKTSDGSGYTPPPATGIFGDVPVGSFGADFIEELYDRGITGGCQASPLLYCPDSAVLRQQMATFLVRTFFP